MMNLYPLAAIGAGLATMGAALGIGRLAAAAAAKERPVSRRPVARSAPR